VSEGVENSRTKEFLILTELCKDPLIDHLRAGLSLPTSGAFNPEQVLNLYYQICRSVQYLHMQDPPIVHRDLKLENFLISTSYSVKLCDFGSATTAVFQPDDSWSANKRSLIEDEIARQTTPMYRAPEMLDLYSNYRIDCQADIWALGCVLFLLCFNKHPFEDGAKLRIINGKFQIPATDRDFTEFHDLIRLTLNTDPAQRPNINEIMAHLENMAKSKSVELSESLVFLKRTEQMMHTVFTAPVASAAATPAAATTPTEHGGQANWMGNATSLFKGNSLFKTIKEASSKVIDTVHSSINRTDLDMNYLTSRLIGSFINNYKL
jgi:cyclin G-associated kinase